MKNVKIEIFGMSCMNCVGKVENGVAELAGTDNVLVDLQGKYMTVDIDESLTTVEAVKDKVVSLGFEAVEAAEKKKTGLLGKLQNR